MILIEVGEKLLTSAAEDEDVPGVGVVGANEDEGKRDPLEAWVVIEDAVTEGGNSVGEVMAAVVGPVPMATTWRRSNRSTSRPKE